MTMQVANTILEQLGGGRFVGMTGARDLVGSNDTLSFRIPGTHTRNHVNKVRVTLDASDTYTVEFFRIRGSKFTRVATHEDVYGDMLADIFTAETGLDTHF